jgi:alpha,alpha-trehalose phosphorylase
MPALVTPEQFDAVLFDLDGVLTTTRAVHAAAWKRTFDEFLRAWDARQSTTSAPFDERSDYATYVDGKPRQDGVRAFLTARGIRLPEAARTPGRRKSRSGAWAIASSCWWRTNSSGPGSRSFPGRWPGCGSCGRPA